MSKAIIGIDVSKLDLSISLLIDNVHYQTKIDNNQQGFKLFIKWMKKHKITKAKACMEATGHYGTSFANFLYSNNYDVSVVNPICITAFAKSKLSRHKTDKVDSMIIAEYANQNDLPLYTPKNAVLQELQNLYRGRQTLKEQYSQTQNYLEDKDNLSKTLSTSYERLSKYILKEIEKIELAIDTLLTESNDIKEKIDNIETIPGIGKMVIPPKLAVIRSRHY